MNRIGLLASCVAAIDDLVLQHGFLNLSNFALSGEDDAGALSEEAVQQYERTAVIDKLKLRHVQMRGSLAELRNYLVSCSNQIRVENAQFTYYEGATAVMHNAQASEDPVKATWICFTKDLTLMPQRGYTVYLQTARAEPA